jgi:CMP/dCMP kinase
MILETTTMDQIITIDGPAASGKSTISRKLADKLGWKWVSTGAFYRTIGLLCLRKDVDLLNEKQVLAAFEIENWSIQMHPEITKVFIDDKDVSSQIYQEDVGTAASTISQHQLIRQAILRSQRDCYSNLDPGVGLIAEGRDCGSVIFPAAGLKVFLTADPERRAQRRAEQEGLDVNKVIKDQQARDARDSKRKVAPMLAPEGAYLLDNSDMTLDEAVELILGRAKKAFDITL